MKRVIGVCCVAAAMATLSFGTVGTKALAMPAGYVQDRGQWDAPPAELDEVGRRGFHEGIEGARKDYENHRQADPNNREEFRHPPVHERDREAYRRGYERGYRLAFDHIMHERR